MNLTPYIEHTLLHPDAQVFRIEELCQEAIEHNFYGVCIQGCHLPRAAELLEGSQVTLGTVVGFPQGAMSTEAKRCEALSYIQSGAQEIDMVINMGWFKSGDLSKTILDIATVKYAIGDIVLKVIIETSFLTDQEKQLAAHCVIEGGADYVKTSTGFMGGGATIDDIKLLSKAVDGKVKIKASGGIKTPDFATALIMAGAHKLGTSSGVSLITQKT
ncbi:MAG: deoxyribose-phosphate aldolase [Gilvibacter sp.]